RLDDGVQTVEVDGAAVDRVAEAEEGLVEADGLRTHVSREEPRPVELDVGAPGVHELAGGAREVGDAEGEVLHDEAPIEGDDGAAGAELAPQDVPELPAGDAPDEGRVHEEECRDDQ